MAEKYILFLSTNYIWGGSEILWSQSIKRFVQEGFKVKAGVLYDYENVRPFLNNAGEYIDLQKKIKPLSIYQRALQKSGMVHFLPKDCIMEELKLNKPDLVIISQGNNIDGRQLIQNCVSLKIPFVTITHLVTAAFWPSLNDEIIGNLVYLYERAKCNFFVSRSTLNVHEQLLGTQFNNNRIIYNPFTKIIPAEISFPSVKNDTYHIALIGRIEMYHKGYDLLVEVLKQDKWKQRPVQFSLFGKGPHLELLKRIIVSAGITNFILHDHVEDISIIWQHHHILLMPSRMEGQSLTLIEAMHFKRAAIATNVGGTSELIDEGETGFLADFPIPQSIDEALERAWERRRDWEQMGINAAKSIAGKHPEDAVTHFKEQIISLL